MENKFLAHIAEDGRERTVFEHLAGAASLAAEFSRPFGGEAQGLLAGTAHDIGKYSAAFQRRLTGDSRRVEHATAGAFECMGRGQPFAAFAVAGHHGGRHLLGTDQPGGPLRAGALRRLGPGGIPARRTTSPFAKQNPGAGMFFTCMLYSCLVDADFLDTEAFMSGKPRGSCSGCWKRRRLPSGHSDVPRPPSKPTERDSPHAESCRSLPGERGLKPRCWQSRRLRRRSLPLTEGIRV